VYCAPARAATAASPRRTSGRREQTSIVAGGKESCEPEVRVGWRVERRWRDEREGKGVISRVDLHSKVESISKTF